MLYEIKIFTGLPFVKKVYYRYHHFGHKVVSINHFLVGKLQISHLINFMTISIIIIVRKMRHQERGAYPLPTTLTLKRKSNESLRRIKTELPRPLLVFLANYFHIFFIRQSYCGYSFFIFVF